MAELVPWEVSLEDGLLNAYLHGKLTVEGGVSVPLGQKILFGSGDTYIYEVSDDKINFAFDNTDAWQITKNSLGGYAVGFPRFLLETASDTNPNIIPNFSDANTGIGTGGTDILSLIAGSLEVIRISEAAGIITANIKGIREFADNAAAITGTLVTGDVYRTGDLMKIVH